jgi:hypothetical protein
MFDGLFQPIHLTFCVIVVVGLFFIFRALWRLGSNLKTAALTANGKWLRKLGKIL